MTPPRPRGQPRPRHRPDRRSDMLRGAAIAAAVLGMVVSGLVARGWRSTVIRQRHERLDRAAASRTATIENVMANYENALQAARSLWLASDSVSRGEFSAIARSLDLPKRYPGLQGIGWRSFVTDAERPAFVARARADGEPRFTIRPAGRSTTSTVSNQTMLAGDLDLPPRERPVAFELFVPVYQRELPEQAPVAERRRILAGWAVGQFRAGDFLNAAMEPWKEQRFIGVELSDETVPDGGPLASHPERFRARGPDLQQGRFTFGGRTFMLRFAPLPGNPTP